MKTTIEYIDGRIDVVKDVAPFIEPEQQEVSFIDESCGLVGEILKFEGIKKITWEIWE